MKHAVTNKTIKKGFLIVNIMDFREKVTAILKKHMPFINEELLEIPPDMKLGDFAYPCFSYAKEMKKSPNEIASELAKKIEPEPPIKKIESVGPYLNIFVDKSLLAESVLNEIYDRKEDYGKTKPKKRMSIIVEFSSPNIAKPLP